jgi:hypothetical protein
MGRKLAAYAVASIALLCSACGSSRKMSKPLLPPFYGSILAEDAAKSIDTLVQQDTVPEAPPKPLYSGPDFEKEIETLTENLKTAIYDNANLKKQGAGYLKRVGTLSTAPKMAVRQGDDDYAKFRVLVVDRQKRLIYDIKILSGLYVLNHTQVNILTPKDKMGKQELLASLVDYHGVVGYEGKKEKKTPFGICLTEPFVITDVETGQRTKDSDKALIKNNLFDYRNLPFDEVRDQINKNLRKILEVALAQCMDEYKRVKDGVAEIKKQEQEADQRRIKQEQEERKRKMIEAKKALKQEQEARQRKRIEAQRALSDALPFASDEQEIRAEQERRRAEEERRRAEEERKRLEQEAKEEAEREELRRIQKENQRKHDQAELERMMIELNEDKAKKEAEKKEEEAKEKSRKRRRR